MNKGLSKSNVSSSLISSDLIFEAHKIQQNKHKSFRISNLFLHNISFFLNCGIPSLNEACIVIIKKLHS